MGEKPTIHIVGAGLAGSECALQLASLGYQVVLIEMRGSGTTTPAHRGEDFAELVCSNSFGSLAGSAAPGELKWEAEQLGSHILAAAFEARVPAGQALGMDRDVFAAGVTRRVQASPKIRIERREVLSLDDVPRPCVIATGPLTSGPLAASMARHFGDEFLYFFDAIAPIIERDSVNMDIAWRADRWDKGTRDYINCPMQKHDYFSFIEEMKAAKKIEPKEFEKETPYFDACMPIEEMLHRGDLTPRFGPMSAKGLTDPRTGKWPFAVVQLRQDNLSGTAYNMVGFQTKMAYADQKRVFRLIPGLEDAEFLKLGSIHRNLYINTPRRLNRDLSSQRDPLLFFAGQITGVEGYFESTCMGLLVARFLDAKLRGVLATDAANLWDGDATAVKSTAAEATAPTVATAIASTNAPAIASTNAPAIASAAPPTFSPPSEPRASSGPSIAPPRASAFGSLLDAITDQTRADHFQPTNINFGHMPVIPEPPEVVPDPNAPKKKGAGYGGYRERKRLDKITKRRMQLAAARKAFNEWFAQQNLPAPSVVNVDKAAEELRAISDAAEIVELATRAAIKAEEKAAGKTRFAARAEARAVARAERGPDESTDTIDTSSTAITSKVPSTAGAGHVPSIAGAGNVPSIAGAGHVPSIAGAGNAPPGVAGESHLPSTSNAGQLSGNTISTTLAE